MYKENELLGEVEVYGQNQKVMDLREKGIRISHFSPASDRCPPLAVLHTVNSGGVCFKMESKTQSQDTPLFSLHSSCLRDNKTAVLPLGEEELHLVAMSSRKNDGPLVCFWGFSVSPGLYTSCLAMLNLRCLGIVFDLDETLIVANTMRSFEDRIDALQRKITIELDPQRLSGMYAEVQRYQDDKNILKQYVENDQVIENGRVLKVQTEVVPAFSDNHPPIVRPLIRLQDRNIILTRINPLIRDTSVLVRLRPAWEDLRNYLTAKGRKRFEVYVCTMAERDYALEMWRLLDPDFNLINSKELLDRIVCVKSGLRKSLYNVFQNGNCHPKMSLVIDDRLKVWDDKDQPRVHVVPAFAPYYAPQAEGNNAVPVLCVARNVACNVRGGFFKDFDDSLLQRIHDASYEDDIRDVASPDVSHYLVSEDDSATANGNKDPLCFDAMADVEVERRLKDAILASSVVSSTLNNLDPRLSSTLQFAGASLSNPLPVPTPQGSMLPFPNKQFSPAPALGKPLGHSRLPESTLHSSPAREEGEVPESELDPDTRRRLLILQHGQDTRDQSLSEPPFPVRPPMPVSNPQVPSRGPWFPAEQEMSPRNLNQAAPKEFHLDIEPMLISKHHPTPSSFWAAENPSGRILQDNQRASKEALSRDDRLRSSHTASTNSFSGEVAPLNRSASNYRDIDFNSGRGFSNADAPAGVLRGIAMKCGTKVEYRPTLVSSYELQFSIEVWFAGEKIGEGIGRTRREAQRHAAEVSLKNLAYKYLSNSNHDSSSIDGDLSRSFSELENGLSSDINSFGNMPLPKEESVSFSTASESSRLMDPRLESSKRSMGSVSALKDLCLVEGLSISFEAQPPGPSNSTVQKDEVYAQVEIDGQVLGKGVGLTWDEAKTQAAEKALGNLKSTLGQYSQKHQGSPRSLQGMSNKRFKPEFPRFLQRMPSSARYSKNASPVP